MRVILSGLEMAWAAGVKKLIVESDCQAAPNNIVEASMEHHYFEVISCIRNVQERDWEVSFQFVWREANQVADALTKLGINTNMHYMDAHLSQIYHLLDSDRDDIT